MEKIKVRTFEEIQIDIQELRNKNPEIKIVTTNGAFDIIHSGHLCSLNKAKSFGDILVIGLNSDSSIKQYKSEDRPIIPQENRAEMLAALEVVDYVVIFNETDPREFLKRVKPNFHVKSKEGYKGIEEEVIKENGGEIILLDDMPSFSTSDIIKKISDILEKQGKEF